MSRYFIGIGSNKNAEHNCVAMIEAIMMSFRQVMLSSIVRTPALGIDAPDYLKCCYQF